MKYFKYNLNGQELRIKIDENSGTIADVLVDGKHPVISEEDMAVYAAVISLALIEYDVEIVHDDEPGFITLAPQGGSWGTPSDLMNRVESAF